MRFPWDLQLSSDMKKQADASIVLLSPYYVWQSFLVLFRQDVSMIYFYSDPHFFHENIIRLAQRPFSSEEEMNHTLINNYNAVVGDDDEVYFLGDIAFNRRKIKKGLLTVKNVNNVLKRLKGRKYLVAGNHDDWWINDPGLDGRIFAWIRQRHVMEYKGKSLIMLHDPAPYITDQDTGEPPHMFLGCDEILIYGHVHDSIVADIPHPSFCACVEQTCYRPVSVAEIFDRCGV